MAPASCLPVAAAAAVAIIAATCFVDSSMAFVVPLGHATDISSCRISTKAFPPRARNGRYRDDDPYEDDAYYYDDGDDDDADDYYDDRPARRRRRRPNLNPIDDLGSPSGRPRSEGGLDVPSPFGRRTGVRLPESVSKALLAGVFVLGIGTGVTVDSQINTNPKDLASRDAVDQAAPNPTICTTYGASAMAFDQRVFVSFNPFNVYVAQADVKPACVLRPSNVVPVLQQRKLINDAEVRSCKQNMNTWAFVGDLDDMPQLSCVYKSEDAQNEFLSNPKLGIGEDVWDDDRAAVDAARKKTSKQVKGGMTEGQAQKKAAAEAMRRQASDVMDGVVS